MNTTFSKHELGQMLMEFVRLHPLESFGSEHRWLDAWEHFVTERKDQRWPRCKECGLRDCQCKRQKGQVA